MGANIYHNRQAQAVEYDHKSAIVPQSAASGGSIANDVRNGWIGAGVPSLSAFITPAEPFELENCGACCLIIIPLRRNSLEIWSQEERLQSAQQDAFTLNYIPADKPYRIRQLSDAEHLVVEVQPPRVETVASAMGFDIDSENDVLLGYRDQDVWMGAQSLRRYLLARQFDGDVYLEGQADILLSHVVSALVNGKSQKRSRREGHFNEEELKVILDAIEKTYDRRITVASLAESFDCDPIQFSKRFKASTGCSPQRFIMDRRITEARRRLTDEDQSIVDIAYGLGFSSQAHLTTAFRQLVGMTPGRYREAYGKNHDNTKKPVSA